MVPTRCVPRLEQTPPAFEALPGSMSMGVDVSMMSRSFKAIFSLFRQSALRRKAVGVVVCVTAAACLVGISGCSQLRPKPQRQYVYVTAKQTFLRDRVAAVSSRTATVENGDKLQVLDHGRRFLKVQTAKGEQGWINEKLVATQELFDQFATLQKDHRDDPAVASGVVRDDVYLHVAPGRETERFYRLPEGEKLKLLRRATLLKPLPPGVASAAAATRAASASTKTAANASKQASGSKEATANPEPPPPPPMEDWWLVRDSKGDTGWLYSRLMDVDAPDTLTRYSEGQRIVGAYVLTRVNDPDAPQDDKNIPEYVTVLSPYQAGLTFDFNQVRVFIWNVKKHRFETAFRERNIEGYLPVQVKMAADPYGKAAASIEAAPTFSFRVLSDEAPAVVPNPVSGAVVPGKTVLKTYRLEGNLVRRLLQPGVTPPGEAHPEPVAEKKKKGRKARRKR